MKSFIAQHRDSIIGVLSGFDRLVLRGHLRTLCYVGGMLRYLSVLGVLLKDFGHHVEQVSNQLKQGSFGLARAEQRPIIYLPSSQTNKEQVALQALRDKPVEQGLVAIISCVEPCMSFDINKNSESKRLELVPRWRKGLHLYHYLIHPTFGWMNIRIQTWFPFTLQICLNGREWLSRMLDADGLRYERADNCFPWIEDIPKAQALFDQQLALNWPQALNPLAALVNPAHAELFAAYPLEYYWTVFQSEWATDILFKDDATLARLYPAMVHHAMTTFQSPDVLRFLGHRLNKNGQVPLSCNTEVLSSFKQRTEGVRVKHSAHGNGEKMYDKHPRLFRVECTINHPEVFKVYRPTGPQPTSPEEDQEMAWQPMRRSVADLHRRAQVSQAANDRYLNTLATVSDKTPLKELVDDLCKPAELKGKHVRALNPWGDGDQTLLAAISRGEFAINGLRNRDLMSHLYSDEPSSPEERRRRSAAISRKLRILRAHGLLKKVTGTHRYMVTERGRLILTALSAAREANTDSLTKAAA